MKSKEAAEQALVKAESDKKKFAERCDHLDEDYRKAKAGDRYYLHKEL